MKRLVSQSLIQTAAVVEKCFLGTVTKTTVGVRKMYFTSSSVSRKDGLYDSNIPPPVSAQGSDKGANGGYSAPSSSGHNVSSVLAPAFKQTEQTTATPVVQQRSGDSHGKVGNSTLQSSVEARREISSPWTTAEKPSFNVLKPNVDRHSSSNPPDDTSLLASRRVDPSTVRQVYYFDTLAFSKKLESKGFTREQAEGCAESLVEIINTTLDHQGRHMVTKPQQEIAVQQLMSEIVSVKKDMTLLQKSEFSSLKTETEKISIELSQVRGHMNDEIVKLKGQFSLDINLERGRAIEAHAENEKKLQQLHNKIETEIANLKTIYEVYRNDVFKYAGGTVIAVGGLILGVLRLWH
ncbi:hypothetical protein BsWGS_16072 [Bradybaena similaris]